MDGYIEKMLHVKVSISDYTDADNLPLYLKGSYKFYAMTIVEKVCLLVELKENINLSVLRKQYRQIKKLSQMECVLCFESVNAYTKQKLIEEAIPFIIKEKQIYMPFLGIVLTNQAERLLLAIKKISYLTQKLLLTAIYQKWNKISLTNVAKALCVSKMSVTRCFDELESLNIPIVSKIGKSRYLVWEKGSVALWSMLRPILRNPVAKEYHLDKPLDVKGLPLSGMSALSRYTLLNDNTYRTYAITKELAKSLKIENIPCVPKGEIPEEIIQVLQYNIPFGDETAVDPLAAILSLSTEEKEDPRVEAAVDKIVKEKVND